MQIEYADDWLVPVTVLEVDRTEHGASWRTFITVSDDMRTSVELLVQFHWHSPEDASFSVILPRLGGLGNLEARKVVERAANVRRFRRASLKG